MRSLIFIRLGAALTSPRSSSFIGTCKRTSASFSTLLERATHLSTRSSFVDTQKGSSASFATLLERAIRQRQLAKERELAGNGTIGSLGENDKETPQDPAMAIFDEIDANGDGVITREEFAIAIEKMRHLDLQRMKRSLAANDIAFNYKGAALGRHVVVTDEFNAWHFIQRLPDYSQVKHCCPPVALPPKANNPKTADFEYTLVLDMDETLLHCSPDLDEAAENPHHTFQVTYQGSQFPVHAWLRPKLQDFLDKVHGKFEVIIFTASQPEYANVILDILDPQKKYFHHRLFRNACMSVEGSYVKDLSVLGRDLSKCVLVDNSPHVFGYNIDNGIPISSWYEDPWDNELEKLEWFLRQISIQPGQDVRKLVREHFECYKLVENVGREGALVNKANTIDPAPATSSSASPIASAVRM